LSLPQLGEDLLERGGFETRTLTPTRNALKMPEILAQGRNPMEAFEIGNFSEAVGLISDSLMEDCSIGGNPPKCMERLAQLVEDAGLTFVTLSFETAFEKTISRIKEILGNSDPLSS
jgi:hypothetical protein